MTVMTSTVSGQSSSRIDSEFDEDEIDYNNDKLDQDDKVVSRTMSCPDQMMKSLSLKESQS